MRVHTAALGAGLPVTWSHREVRGLCSFFGDVKSVARLNSNYQGGKRGKAGVGADEGNAAEQDSQGAAEESERKIAEKGRENQPCFVQMESCEAALAAIHGLDGRVIAGCRLTAASAVKQ